MPLMKRTISAARSRPASASVVAGVLVGAAIGATLFGANVASSSPSETLHRLSLVVYAEPEAKTFVDNADDRRRGRTDNPFGNASAGSGKPTNERLNGPFAGDEGLFSYTLRGEKGQPMGSAVLVCQYDFDKGSFCSASYHLDGGTLIATGSFNFRAHAFTLAISGGTGTYRGATGELDASVASGGATAAVLGRERLVLSIAQPTTAVRPDGMTRYSIATGQEFIHNGDDELRGDETNPLGLHVSGAVEAALRLGSDTPAPGDEALFRFRVYAKPNLEEQLGTATFTCEYAFAETAFCNAVYVLQDGTLSGAGAFGEDATRFVFAITGGTGDYVNRTGDVETSPTDSHTQHLAFELDSD